MRKVILAATQMKCSQNEKENIAKAESNVRLAENNPLIERMSELIAGRERWLCIL